ncbi:hypothetical protein Cgig2_003023 [Carnegiea gigantea]|uniref:Uncharacterized protein n=1 Tax=Carnegiea gigantea TaxID=171969 RepID=A0A9Q1JJF8_9CARY|nr:hypothetical protein Cgig2_003023 [Carnegiea gigantea]
MGSCSHPLFSQLLESEIKKHFDDDVRCSIMQMVDSHSMLKKSQMLKDEGNRLFKTQAYRLVFFRYDKYLQYLCVVVPDLDKDAKLMEELAMLEEAHKDLLSALEFDPGNDEVKKEQLKEMSVETHSGGMKGSEFDSQDMSLDIRLGTEDSSFSIALHAMPVVEHRVKPGLTEYLAI